MVLDMAIKGEEKPLSKSKLLAEFSLQMFSARRTGLEILKALEATEIAGEAAKKILESNNYTKKSTKIYMNELKKSFAYQDLKTFKRAAKFLETERIFAHYPELINGLFYRLLKNNGKPREKITRAAIKHILTRTKLLKAIKDVIGGLTSL